MRYIIRTATGRVIDTYTGPGIVIDFSVVSGTHEVVAELTNHGVRYTYSLAKVPTAAAARKLLRRIALVLVTGKYDESSSVVIDVPGLFLEDSPKQKSFEGQLRLFPELEDEDE